MKQIEIECGTSILHAASLLIANAPAFAMFNEVRIEATTADTDQDAIVYAADTSGVIYNHAEVTHFFQSRGWPPGANCKPFFNEEDPRNYAGWIVGQWLESRIPLVLHFIEKWRVKFDGA